MEQTLVVVVDKLSQSQYHTTYICGFHATSDMMRRTFSSLVIV